MFVFKTINTQETWGMVEYMNKLLKIRSVYGTALALRSLVCSVVVPSHQGEICCVQQGLQPAAGQAAGGAGGTGKAMTSLPDLGNQNSLLLPGGRQEYCD